MKIALISMPRVGSNSLFDMLINHYDETYEYRHEPYTPFYPPEAWEFDVTDGSIVPDNFL